MYSIRPPWPSWALVCWLLVACVLSARVDDELIQESPEKASFDERNGHAMESMLTPEDKAALDNVAEAAELQVAALSRAVAEASRVDPMESPIQPEVGGKAKPLEAQVHTLAENRPASDTKTLEDEAARLSKVAAAASSRADALRKESEAAEKEALEAEERHRLRSLKKHKLKTDASDPAPKADLPKEDHAAPVTESGVQHPHHVASVKAAVAEAGQRLAQAVLGGHHGPLHHGAHRKASIAADQQPGGSAKEAEENEKGTAAELRKERTATKSRSPKILVPGEPFFVGSSSKISTTPPGVASMPKRASTTAAAEDVPCTTTGYPKGRVSTTGYTPMTSRKAIIGVDDSPWWNWQLWPTAENGPFYASSNEGKSEWH